MGDDPGAANDSGLRIEVGRAVRVRYKNWRGHVADRTIEPIAPPFYGSTYYHANGSQWLVRAKDLDRGVERVFALADMGPVPTEAEEV